MNQNYLDALTNFAYALEELVEEMRNQSEATAKGKGTNNFKDINSSLENIATGIDDLKESNKKILSNQETLIQMGKDREKSKGLLSNLTGKENKGNIKDGVSTILLMSGAIVAIGLAFKIVSGVDFASVIALSVALPLIAIAFTQVATTIKDNKLGFKDLLFTTGALVLMAGAITLSSWIMAGIVPIGPWQLLTALGISVTLAIAAYGMSFLVEKLKGVKMVDLLKLPIALVAISTSIMLSSHILSQTQPINPGLLLNIVFQGAALSIVAAAMSVPLYLFKKMKLQPADVAKGGLSLIIIAGVIMASSHLLALGNYSNYPSLGWAVSSSLALMLFSVPVIAFGLLAMSGIGAAAIASGALLTLLVAGTILATSLILGGGTYDVGPGIGWVVSTVAALGGFSVIMLSMGALALTGVGFIIMAAGSSMVLYIADTIVAVSNKLGEGNYSYAGNLAAWGAATALLYLTFTPMMVALGAMGLVSSIIQFFGGPNPFELAKVMMIQIADTIVSVSHALAGGNWADGPTEDWAKGVSLAIGAFAPVFKYLQNSGVYSAFFGSDSMKPWQYALTMRQIGFAIIDVANVFNEGRVDKWRGGPTKEWAEGVGLAIGAFSPIFKILSSQGVIDAILGKEAVSPEDMANAVRIVSQSILDAAQIFNSQGNAVYKGGPSKKWSEGVGKSIQSFTELYAWVFDGPNWETEDVDHAKAVISRVAQSILDIAIVFRGGKDGPPKWSRYPSKKWADGVTSTITSFISLYEWVFDGSNWDESDIEQADKVIFSIAYSIRYVGRLLEPLSEMSLPDSNATEGLAKNIRDWADLVEDVEDLPTSGLYTAARRLERLADGFNALAESLNNLTGSIKGFNPDFIKVLADVSGVDIEIKNKTDWQDQESGSWWDSLLGRVPEKEEQEIVKSATPEIKSPEKKEEDMSFKDIHSKLEELNQKLQVIAQNSNNMSEYVDELRSGTGKAEIEM